MKKTILIIALACVLAAALFIAFLPSEKEQPAPEPKTAEPSVITKHVDPTCTEAGYTLYEDTQTGQIRVEDGEPARGHVFTESGDLRTCQVCGYEEPLFNAIDFARIDLSGSMEGMSKDQRVLLNFEFEDFNKHFNCYAYTSWQGHSSLAYPKKNYTIRLFADEGITEKYKLSFNNWQLEHKYVLKANYHDATQYRNLICAQVWGEVAASRNSVHERLKSTSNYGATAGFPVAVWHDGAFHGLYTMNLHKDDDLYDMYEGGMDAIIICNSAATDESFFRKEASFADDQSDWEVEFSTKEYTDLAEDRFNELIRFVMDADDAAFAAQLHNHLDVDAAIDYLLFMYTMGLTNHAAKDLIMISYEGSPWIPTVYDMEDAFGLFADGTDAHSADFFLPSVENGIWSSNTGSLLWDRLLRSFEPQIRARWLELRENILSRESLHSRAETLLNAIPANIIEMDLALYADRNLVENPNEQILSYIDERLPKLDSIFAPSGSNDAALNS